MVDRVKYTEAAVRNGCGLSGISREFPLKGAVRSAATADVSLKIGSGIDQLCIGIFESSPTFGLVQRCPFREDIADCGIDRAGQETMSLVQAGHNIRGNAADERKGARGLRTFQLSPTPRDETHIMVARQGLPDFNERET